MGDPVSWTALGIGIFTLLVILFLCYKMKFHQRAFLKFKTWKTWKTQKETETPKENNSLSEMSRNSQEKWRLFASGTGLDVYKCAENGHPVEKVPFETLVNVSRAQHVETVI